eukprot:199619-Amphidinium_carterae.1
MPPPVGLTPSQRQRWHTRPPVLSSGGIVALWHHSYVHRLVSLIHSDSLCLCNGDKDAKFVALAAITSIDGTWLAWRACGVTKLRKYRHRSISSAGIRALPHCC